MLEQANALYDRLVAWRRDFHQHPELSFQEFRTAKVVAEELTALGLEVQTGVGKTGVVAYIGDGDGPVIGIRGDMDALPITEANDVPYASQNEGVMHACGHDAHTAILLGVAHLLSGMDDRPPGQFRLFFQPSEEAWDAEGKSGASRMIDDGIMEGVDAVIALHVDSLRPANKVMIGAGYVGAAVDDFRAVIKGTGGHGAYPHNGTDPVFMLGQVINALWGVRARRIDPVKPAVVSIGSVHGGDVSNVIPSEIEIVGTIRSYHDDVREKLWEEVEAAIAVCKAFGGDYTFKIGKGYPSLINDEDVSDLIRDTAVDLIGEDGMLEPKQGMGAEDFAYMTRAVPGAMFNLGARYDDMTRPHHTPVFDIAESALPVGAAVLAQSALRLMEKYRS